MYPRFPLPLGEEGKGKGTNGQPQGAYSRNFTAFAVLYLSDVLQGRSGNFTVWPGSHRAYEAYFKEHGHEVLQEGRLSLGLPAEPVMVTARAGDLVVAHHALMHGACPNESAHVRLAAIARLRHVGVEALGADGYPDIWKEWDGVREVVAGEAV